MKDYYKILNIKSDASDRDLRRAWHKMARKYHPDLHPDNDEAEEHFKQISEAYEVLSDERRRAVYDLTGRTVFHSTIIESSETRNYFYAVADKNSLEVNDEVSITFTYTGKGRVFRKPSFNDFFLSGPPYVAFRDLIHEDHPVRETSLTYVLAPVNQGILKINKAYIKINNKEFSTEPFNIEVKPAKCYFLTGHIANGAPLKFPMNFEYNSTSKSKLKGHNPGHVILIPRSRSAQIFHGIGSVMKWTFMLSGAIYFKNNFELNVLIGAAAGSLIGGVNCQLMYRLIGMRSKFRYAEQFPLVNEYADRGYQYGSATGTPLVGSGIFYKISRLIT